MAEPLVAVLAAGRGTRFGGGKLEAMCAGRPLGRWILDAVVEAGLVRGVIVTYTLRDGLIERIAVKRAGEPVTYRFSELQLV